MAEDDDFIFRTQEVLFTLEDLKDFTGTDERDYETAVGIDHLTAAMSLAGVGPSKGRLQVIAGFLWIVKRRKQQRLTYPEVLDTITLRDLEEAEGPSDPPTKTASQSGKRSSKRGPSSRSDTESDPGTSTS